MNITSLANEFGNIGNDKFFLIATSQIAYLGYKMNNTHGSCFATHYAEKWAKRYYIDDFGWHEEVLSVQS